MILPKAIYKYHAFPIEIPMAFITDMGKTILKLVWKYIMSQILKTILKKNKAGSIHFLILIYIIKLQ